MFLVLAPAARVAADALVFTRAMKATTVMEVFVEDDAVRVELEIGVSDVDAFRNLMPDEIYERLGHAPEAWSKRMTRFLAEDLVLRTGEGIPLAGELVEITGRRRVVRDEITGEPLPGPEGEGGAVVFARLRLPLASRPAAITLAPPAIDGRVRATIGFVVYHGGLPVNDFRYLGRAETLDLDWDDPWFSAFRNRNLRRQFFAPVNGFLYVDAFEVRKEITVRPKDLQPWIDLGLEGATVIPVATQATLKTRVAAFLRERCPVTIDGRSVPPVLDRIHFVRRTLRTTGIVDPPEDLPVVSATLGVIFSYPVSELPQEVTMTWDLFGPRLEVVPTVATDEAGGLPYSVTPDDPVLRWQNFLTNPTSRGPVEVAAPPRSRRWSLPLLSLLCVVLLVPLAVRGAAGRGRGAMLVGALVLLAGAVLLRPFVRVDVPVPFGGAASLPDDEATAVVGDLLHNVYRAFDSRDEGTIYDLLDRSAAGEILTQIYLETRRALELQNQGGARARVDAVEMLAGAATPLSGAAGFRARCTWSVTGSVGHWGHLHQRRNQYEAELRVEPIDGAWKITGMELLNEERL